MKRKLLYRTVPHNGGLVFAEESQARRIACIHQAIDDAKTWKEFRSMIPPKEFDDIMEFLDDGESDIPEDDDLFSGESLPGWVEGDYPTWLQQEMDKVIPREILYKYCSKGDTWLNGSYWNLSPDHLEAICAELVALGWELEQAEDLPFH